MSRVFASEREFQAAVVDMAKLLGWRCVHVQPAQIGADRWTTPTILDGRGWPDLVLVHEPTSRLVFAELKSQKGLLAEDQARWLRALRKCREPEVYLWRPSHWHSIDDLLRNPTQLALEL